MQLDGQSERIGIVMEWIEVLIRIANDRIGFHPKPRPVLIDVMRSTASGLDGMPRQFLFGKRQWLNHAICTHCSSDTFWPYTPP